MNRAVLFLLTGLLIAPSDCAEAQNLRSSTVAAATECAARFEQLAGTQGGDGSIWVADVCADLSSAFEVDGWDEALVAASIESLSPRALRELVGLLEYYERPLPQRAAPALEELGAIVASLEQFGPAERLPLWDRVAGWIRDQLGFRGVPEENRLIEWLRRLSIPDAWAVAIAYVLGTLALILVGLVALNELLARVGRRVSRRRRGTGRKRATSVAARLEEVRRLPTQSRPGKLLVLLVERLRERFGSAVRDSMTGGELIAAARALDFARSRELENVVSAAERVTFAGWRPDAAEIELVLEHGRAVLDELDDEGSQG